MNTFVKASLCLVVAIVGLQSIDEVRCDALTPSREELREQLAMHEKNLLALQQTKDRVYRYRHLPEVFTILNSILVAKGFVHPYVRPYLQHLEKLRQERAPLELEYQKIQEHLKEKGSTLDSATYDALQERAWALELILKESSIENLREPEVAKLREFLKNSFLARGEKERAREAMTVELKSEADLKRLLGGEGGGGEAFSRYGWLIMAKNGYGLANTPFAGGAALKEQNVGLAWKEEQARIQKIHAIRETIYPRTKYNDDRETTRALKRRALRVSGISVAALLATYGGLKAWVGYLGGDLNQEYELTEEEYQRTLEMLKEAEARL